MRNHDFVSDGFQALSATCLVLLCSSWLVIALLAWLWRNSSPPKLLVTLKSRVRSIPANWTVRQAGRDRAESEAEIETNARC